MKIEKPRSVLPENGLNSLLAQPKVSYSLDLMSYGWNLWPIRPEDETVGHLFHLGEDFRQFLSRDAGHLDVRIGMPH